MKCEAHGTQQLRHINLIGEGVSTAQRSTSLVQSINQCFLKNRYESSQTSICRNLEKVSCGGLSAF